VYTRPSPYLQTNVRLSVAGQIKRDANLFERFRRTLSES
jgi:hypothetical protein